MKQNRATAITDEASELAHEPVGGLQPVAIRTVSSRIAGQANESLGLDWYKATPSLGGTQPGLCIHVTPQSPAEFYVPEKCLRLLQSYVKGSSEGLHWPRDSHGSFLNEDIVRSWCSPLMSAAWVLKEGKLESATLLLGKFVDQCPQQLARHDPLVFVFVYTSVLFFAPNHPRITNFLLRSLYAAAQRLPDAGRHPLRTLILLLCQLGPDGIVQHASKILLGYVGFIKAELGAACPLVQDMTSDAVMRLIVGRMIGAETAAECIRRMIRAAEAQGWHRCRYYLQLKMHLSEAYLKMGQLWYAEARRAAEEVTEDQYDDIRDNGLHMDYHMLMCKINEAEGRWEDAKLSALRAVIASWNQFGKDSDWAVNTLIVYTRILRRMGEHQLAEAVAQDRDMLIGRLCER
ncbi:hypothetical protein SLS64_000677 [Diaporthe eres]|uniref:Clr5 domain-containing protein n=1 Tax=Diaporthe eres TaxID=83184 RepID=A0ABR1NRA9_DIAER